MTQQEHGMGNPRPFPSLRRLSVLACVLPLIASTSGCLVIEKKTLVLIVPPDSKEVRMYYAFEGLSVLDHKDSKLESAKDHLDELGKDNLHFFIMGLGGSPADNPFLKHVQFERLRFYTDPNRKRSLCADRKVTIVDRDRFAAALNAGISEWLSGSDLTPAQVQDEIKKARKELKTQDTRDTADAFGAGALLKVAQGLVEIAIELDKDSIAQIQAAARKRDFAWIKFEPETIRLDLPMTGDCAKKIAGDTKTAKWLKEMCTFVEPLDLVANDKGLSIVLGEKGKAIRFTYTDSRDYRPRHEPDLMAHVGKPKPILIDDKPANADKLIERFIADNIKKK
jgi:hypothetical protein